MNPVAVPTMLLTVVAFWIGIRLESRVKRRAARAVALIFSVVAALPGLLFVFYYIHLFDNAAWFYNFRTIPLTELLSGAMGVLAGFLYSLTEPESFGEKLSIPAVLFVFVAIPFAKPILAPLDSASLKDNCEGEVCLQSTPATCGPTSAVNILRNFGRNASERQLANEAYTYRSGTEIWYLSRALRQRGFRTEVLIKSPLPEVLPTPSIAGVVLGGGMGHFIAVISQDAQGVTVIDPLTGRFVISRSSLAMHYRFTGFFLAVSENK